MKILGVILIFVALDILGYKTFLYATTDTPKITHFGPVEDYQRDSQPIDLPSIIGGGCLVTGVVAVIAGGRGKI